MVQILYVLCERLLFLCRAETALDYAIGENHAPFTRSFYCSRFDDEPVRHFRSSSPAERTGGEKRSGRRVSFQLDDLGIKLLIALLKPGHCTATFRVRPPRYPPIGCPKSRSYSEDINWPDDEITIDCSAPFPSRPIDLRVALHSDQTKVIESFMSMSNLNILISPPYNLRKREIDSTIKIFQVMT